MTDGIISDVTWVKVDKDGTAVERSDIFNEMMEGYFPSHFAPVHKTSNIHALPVDGKKKRGKPPALGLIVHFVGVCGLHRHGCPTKWDGGFCIDQLKLIGEGMVAYVDMKLGFKGGGCIHNRQKDLGRLTGEARKRERDEGRYSTFL